MVGVCAGRDVVELPVTGDSIPDELGILSGSCSVGNQFSSRLFFRYVRTIHYRLVISFISIVKELIKNDENGGSERTRKEGEKESFSFEFIINENS